MCKNKKSAIENCKRLKIRTKKYAVYSSIVSKNWFYSFRLHRDQPQAWKLRFQNFSNICFLRIFRWKKLFISVYHKIRFRITTEEGYRIKVYFFLCDIPKSLFCQKLYLNIIDVGYSDNTEEINRKRICGQCPETIVTSTNQIQVLLQADAGDDPELSRKFALRLEKTLGKFIYQIMIIAIISSSSNRSNISIQSFQS